MGILRTTEGLLLKLETIFLIIIIPACLSFRMDPRRRLAGMTEVSHPSRLFLRGIQAGIYPKLDLFFPAYVGSRESIVYRTKDTGSMTQTSIAPVTVMKARDIEIKEMIPAG